jgi:exosortase A
MTDASPTTLAFDENAHQRSWVLSAAAAMVAIAAVAPFFSHEIGGAVRVWIGSRTYNHCFLIIPIVIYLVWQRRDALADVVPRPAPLGLVAILALSFVWVFAAKLDILEARQFVFVGIVQAMLFTVLGHAAYRRLMGPLLYLFFLVPSGEFLVPKLQDLTANFAVAGLHLVGVPVYSDGTFIEIPEGTFVVAEACAGLRFLVASVAYGVLFALVVYTSWWRRAIFVALSLIIPVIANGVRAFGIILAAHLIGSARAAVADHVLYGWMFFSIVIFLLTLAGMSFAQRAPGRTGTDLTNGHEGVLLPRPRLRYGIALLAAVLAAAGPASALLAQGRPAPVTASESAFPQPGAPWQRVSVEPEWRPVVVGARRQLLDTFSNGRSTVERYVALYAAHGTDNNVVRSLDRIADGEIWRRANSHKATVRLGDRDYSVDVTEIRSGNRRRLVWSFYVIDGRTVAGATEAKLLQAYASVLGRGATAAFVAMSTPITQGNAASSEMLREFLGSLPSLAGYVATIR